MPIIKLAIALVILNRLLKADWLLSQEPEGNSEEYRAYHHHRHDPRPTAGVQVQFVRQIRPQQLYKCVQAAQEPNRDKTAEGSEYDSNSNCSDQPVGATK